MIAPLLNRPHGIIDSAPTLAPSRPPGAVQRVVRRDPAAPVVEQQSQIDKGAS
jgi:hypothetical protein